MSELTLYVHSSLHFPILMDLPLLFLILFYLKMAYSLLSKPRYFLRGYLLRLRNWGLWGRFTVGWFILLGLGKDVRLRFVPGRICLVRSFFG